MACLRVTDNVDNNEGLNTIKMTINEFTDICNHPWIATAGFDFVLIDLDSRIKYGTLSAMLGKYIVVPVLPEVIDKDIVRLLSELYPEKHAELMFTFIKNKGDISTIVKDLAEQHEWEYYYNQA